jgi:hypothetical protein
MSYEDSIIQVADEEDALLFTYLPEVLDTNGYKVSYWAKFPLYFRVNIQSNKITGYQDDLNRLDDSWMVTYNRGVPIRQFLNLEEKPYEFW